MTILWLTVVVVGLVALAASWIRAGRTIRSFEFFQFTFMVVVVGVLVIRLLTS